MTVKLTIEKTYNNKPENARYCANLMRCIDGYKSGSITEKLDDDAGKTVRVSLIGDFKRLADDIGFVLGSADDDKIEESKPLLDPAVGDRVRIEAPLRGDTDIYEGREGVVVSIAEDNVDVRFDVGYKELSGIFPMQRLRKIWPHELQVGDVVKVEFPDDYPLDLRHAHELCQDAIAIITGFDTTDTGVRRAILKQGNIEDRVGIENLIYLRPSKLCVGDPIWVKEMPDPDSFKIGDKVIATFYTGEPGVGVVEKTREGIAIAVHDDGDGGVMVEIDDGGEPLPAGVVKHHPDSVFYFDTHVLKFERNDKGETLVITESGGSCPLTDVELNLEELAVRVEEQLRAIADIEAANAAPYEQPQEPTLDLEAQPVEHQEAPAPTTTPDIEPNPITIQEVEKALEIKAKRTYTITAATLEREMQIPFGRAQKIMDALYEAEKEKVLA